MKFLTLALDDCEGTLLAHRTGGINKGTCLTDAHLQALKDAGHTSLTVVRLDAGDMDENTAAERIGKTLCTAHIRHSAPHTGRVNLYATADGVFQANADLINAINSVDEAITVATLANYSDVRQGTMIATVKIIPYAVSDKVIENIIALSAGSALTLCPYVEKKLVLIFTKSPSTTDKQIEKAIATTMTRLAHYKAHVIETIVLPHDIEPLTHCLMEHHGHADMVLILGAAATIDRRDIIPTALCAAGGAILRHGMPVDPGNLILLGQLGDIPIIGLPGCAKSPARNGLDLVLQRLMAGIDVTSGDLGMMGVGGLLKETQRGQPREVTSAPSATPHITAVLLAAGSSRRMGVHNKLLQLWKDMPLVTHAVNSLMGASFNHHIVITGHEADHVTALLPPRFEPLHNNLYDEGMSTSITLAIQNVPDECDAVLFMLADMPDVKSTTITLLIEALASHPEALALVPTWQGKRGNPVIWRREAFSLLGALQGDQGARQIMQNHAERIVEIPVEDAGVLLDVDTEAALIALRNKD